MSRHRRLVRMHTHQTDHRWTNGAGVEDPHEVRACCHCDDATFVRGDDEMYDSIGEQLLGHLEDAHADVRLRV